jgi:hypothetical protein
MLKPSLTIACFLITITSFGQTNYKNDTLQLDKFKGVLCDSLLVPHASRNKFPKIRFKPTLAEIKEFESSFIQQYAHANEKANDLFYKQYSGKYVLEDQWLDDYKKDGKKSIASRVKSLKNQYHDFDRFYYGYIGKNGMHYLRIEFKPRYERYLMQPGTGEAQVYNLPPLAFNLDKHELNLAGWTGEGDE